MTEQTQGNNLQDVLKWEEEGFFSRDEIMIHKGENLALGAIVATEDGEASSRFDVDNPGDAYGITIAAYDATEAAVPGVVIARNARIDVDNLVWPVISPVITDEQKAGILAVLATRGIIPASGVVDPIAPSEGQQ